MLGHIQLHEARLAVVAGIELGGIRWTPLREDAELVLSSVHETDDREQVVADACAGIQHEQHKRREDIEHISGEIIKLQDSIEQVRHSTAH
jgi:hypothetical protein